MRSQADTPPAIAAKRTSAPARPIDPLARLLALAARRADDPAMRRWLKRLADDDGRDKAK